MKKTITLIAISAMAFSANAQYYQQCPKLTANGLSSDLSFGWSASISLDGKTAVVGAPGHNSGDPGAAVVFAATTPQAWTQVATLVGTGTANEGQSVAISGDGNTIVVGGPGDNGDVGAAWIYVQSGGSWVQQAKLVGTGATGNAEQGFSVAISGDGNTVLVGGPADNSNFGAVWVYTRSGTSWTQIGAKLVGSSGSSLGGEEQGFSVAISSDGSTAIVGAINGRNPGGYSVGAVYFYVLSSGVYTQEYHGYLTGAVSGFGASVAISSDGSTAIVGAPAINEAVVLERSGATWVPQGSALVGTFPVGNAQQGSSVALSTNGDTAVIGGGINIYSPSSGDLSAGQSWVFTRSGGSWSQLGSKYVGLDAAGNSQQGSSVAMSGDGSLFIVGGFADNNYDGAVWVYSTQIPSSVTPVNLSEGMRVYPNPATDELRIDFKNPINEPTTITIIDELGRIVAENVFDGKVSAYQESIGYLVPGAYILKVSSMSTTEQKYLFVKE